MSFYSIPVTIVYDDGRKEICESKRQAGDIVGMNSENFKKQMIRCGEYKGKGFIIRDATEAEKDAINFMAGQGAIKRTIEVTFPDGSKKAYPSLQKAAEDNGVKPYYIILKLRTCGEYKVRGMTFRDHSFKPLEPKEKPVKSDIVYSVKKQRVKGDPLLRMHNRAGIGLTWGDRIGEYTKDTELARLQRDALYMIGIDKHCERIVQFIMGA